MKRQCSKSKAPFNAADQLRDHARKLTGPRRKILNLLESEAHPLTIRELFERLPSGGCDIATLYRSIHLLQQLNLVKRFDFGDGIARFELTNHSHHHHLICRACSAVVEIEDCFPEELEQRIATGNGFTSITHKLEFFGICPSCQDE
jgi:Fur family ferric uptake transcriptional regulator